MSQRSGYEWARRNAVAGLGLLALLAGAPLGLALAQSVVSDSAGDERSIEIEAEDGIEWLRDAKRYLARGNATATRGGVTVRADLLTAYYRGGEGGERQTVFRVDADGNVTITSGETEASGDKAVYHLDQKVAVLIGRELQLVNDDATITAEDSLEYWEERELAVARGNATIVQEANRLVAGILTAYIREDAAGGRSVQRIDALEGVHISTPEEIIRGKEGVYDVPNERATICGDVKITRGANQLNGECAVVDMATGKSRLTGGTGGRVQGLILPTQ